MSKTSKPTFPSAIAALGIALLGGCASDGKEIAQQALDKANAAQECCDTLTARVDRMLAKDTKKKK